MKGLQPPLPRRPVEASVLNPRWAPVARHYLRDLVYAANDGLITTFAVVAGVRGAGFASRVVLALGLANLMADGLSMALGNYLGIKSERSAELGDGYREWEEALHAAKHGAMTWVAFFVAGLVPLLPFLIPQHSPHTFLLSLIATAAGLFGAGALRTLVTRRPWWLSGAEMLLVGSLAGAAAFAVGRAVEWLR